MSRFASIRSQYQHLLWSTDLSGLRPVRRGLVTTLRLLHVIGRDLTEGQLTLRAMSLVYTTLLSLVPLLALAFSVLKAFGVHNQIRPTLLVMLEPLGARGIQLTEQVIGFVDNMRVGVLGAVGLGMLVYTVTSLLQKVEDAFNHVWRVRHPRRLTQRFSQYLSVLTVGPLLVFSALGITATLLTSQAVQALAKIEPFGTLIGVIGQLIPYLLVIAAFAFVYAYMPNTRVRFRSAMVGALVAGILWQSLGWGFAAFVAGSTKYTMIYAGFAIVIMAMIWLYLNWLVVLIGASLAYYHQHPEQLLLPHRELQLSGRMREKLALLAAAQIGQHFYRGEPAWTVEGLAGHLRMPTTALEPVIGAMRQRGLLLETADEPPCLVPARVLDSVTIKELLDAIRTDGEEPGLSADTMYRIARVDQLIQGMDESLTDGLRGQTWRDLVEASMAAVHP
jgi:membrane protein